jgi:hypothetical protein
MKQSPSLSVALGIQHANKKKSSKAGMTPILKENHDIEPADLMHDGERAESIVDAIMRKRKAKKMAAGGEVDLEEHSEQATRTMKDPAGEEQYDDSQISPQPIDSNEHGDEIEADKHDMVKQIRAKLRVKRAA